MEADHLAGLLGLAFAAYGVGTVAAVIPGGVRQVGLRLAHWFAALGGAAMVVAAVGALLTGQTVELGTFPLVPVLSGLHFRMDPLSALFVLLIGGLGLAASIYANGYTAGHHGPDAPSPLLLGSMWNLFIAGMAAVVLAADGFSFLFAWELMSIASFLLVLAEHHELSVRQAGYFYVVMTHVGTAFLFGAFLTLFAHAKGSLDFDAFRTAAASLPVGLRSTIFVLLFIGFGTKAGLVPLHVWLPRAHPAAPSHVSALMSGAMVKTAVYGMLRFAFFILGVGPGWWGTLLVVMGVLSTITGVLNATQQNHLKRLLAYSTVENVGLLFMGIGAALLAQTHGLAALADVALAAVLFHSLSHASFKGLAFLGAGAVLKGTGTVEMERLGGLIQRMPKVAALFLVAMMAVAGLPLFSGFIGEWLSLQTFLHLALAGTGFGLRLGALLAAAAVALAAGLAAAAGVKAFGATFLALPRSSVVEQAHEASPSMLIGMGLLAAAVVALGFFPGLALRLAATVTGGQPVASGGIWTMLTVPSVSPDTFRSQLAPLAAPAVVAVLALLALVVTVVLGRGWPRWRRDMTWTCGIEPDAGMEYSAAGYSNGIKLMFRGLLQPVRTLQVDRSTHPLFPSEVRYRSELKALYEQHLYRPVTKTVMGAASRLQRLQTGSLQTYLLYLLLAAVVVIVVAR